MLAEQINNFSVLIKVVGKLAEVHAIYIIGYKENRVASYSFVHSGRSSFTKAKQVYTLLVISHNLVDDPPKFMNEVYNKSNRKLEVHSIHYTYNEVKYRLNEGNNFLSRITSNGFLAYQENNSLIKYPHHVLYHPRVYEEIENIWKLRSLRAAFFLNKTTICENDTDEHSRYLLFQEVVKQTCLGLLYLYWEFQPTYFTIPFLLNLCSQFTDLPEIVYPKRSFRSKDAYHKLCHASYHMDYQRSFGNPDTETNYIEKVVSIFYEKAEKQGRQKLSELKKQHDKRQ